MMIWSEVRREIEIAIRDGMGDMDMMGSGNRGWTGNGEEKAMKRSSFLKIPWWCIRRTA
jgi:hypothetical protein